MRQLWKNKLRFRARNRTQNRLRFQKIRKLNLEKHNQGSGQPLQTLPHLEASRRREMNMHWEVALLAQLVQEGLLYKVEIQMGPRKMKKCNMSSWSKAVRVVKRD
jgi:hypothetical protein